MMIKETYCSQDIAMRLRQKGFEDDSPLIPQHVAMRWLREEKHIFVEITKTHDGRNYEVGIWKNRRYIGAAYDDMEFETYELAVAFGMLYVLTKVL